MLTYNIRNVIADTFNSFRNVGIAQIPTEAACAPHNPFFMSQDIALYMAVTISARNIGFIKTDKGGDYHPELARSFYETAHFLITSRYSLYHAEGTPRTTPTPDQWKNVSNHDSAWRGAIDEILSVMCGKARAYCELHMPAEQNYRAEVEFQFESQDLAMFKFYQLETVRKEDNYFKDIVSVKPLDFSFKLSPAQGS